MKNMKKYVSNVAVNDQKDQTIASVVEFVFLSLIIIAPG
jgi:hypothetical protein